MKFGKLDHFYTGVAIPVSALRSELSCGVGEFLDLEILGKWCSLTGIEIIQILPVNDTGQNNSPYSAVSALALHPLFIRLQALPEAIPFMSKIEHFRIAHENVPKINYSGILEAKLAFLSEMFEKNRDAILRDGELIKWIKDNPWIKPYAVYYQFKKKYNFYHWKFWPLLQHPTEAEIEGEWDNNPDNSFFHAWIQYHLEKQLVSAANALKAMGINLKGDIPILMNEDSVDVWMYRKYFDLSYKAGAPPDMFSHLGQNWNFPVFNWEVLEEADYLWWRLRLKQAEKFYHACRIDHVLGFFRIYKIPATETSGKLGYFDPGYYITKKQMKDAGFDDGRIRWMTFPHIPGEEVDALAGEKSGYIKNTYLSRISCENLYNLQPEYESEKIIEGLEEDPRIKNLLLNWHRNRALLEVKPGEYHRTWDFEESRAFKSLTHAEKERLHHLIKDAEARSERIWAKHGEALLRMMLESSDMLLCAEDLGVIPACVPAVLKKLEILSLKIERWAREYDKPGQPYIPVKKYPRLSVCTPSVHDTNTLRGWWEEDMSDEEKASYFSLLGLKTKCPFEYTPQLADTIIKHSLSSNSVFAIFQVQDLFSLFKELTVLNAADERVNVPGTISGRNWSYRIYSSIEFLVSFSQFNEYLMELVEERKSRVFGKK